MGTLNHLHPIHPPAQYAHRCLALLGHDPGHGNVDINRHPDVAARRPDSLSAGPTSANQPANQPTSRPSTSKYILLATYINAPNLRTCMACQWRLVHLRLPSQQPELRELPCLIPAAYAFLLAWNHGMVSVPGGGGFRVSRWHPFITACARLFYRIRSCASRF